MNRQTILISKLKLITVEPVLFTYMMTVFMETYALQKLIEVKSCISLEQPVSLSDCNHNNITNTTLEYATKMSKYNNAFFFSLTLVATFYVGSWSDRLGRKFPMVIAPIGTVIAAIINSILSFFIRSNISYIFVSSFVSSVTFGTVGIVSTTFGYISDFTREESRTKRIVILEAMIFIGGTAGIFAAGYFLQDLYFESTLNSFTRLFIFEAILSFCIVLYIVYRIPNSTSDAQSLQNPLSCSGLFSLTHILDSLRTVFRYREEGKRSKIILLLVALFFVFFGSVVQMILGYYYVNSLGIHWSFKDYTDFHSIQFALEGVMLLVGLPLLFNFLNVPDPIVGILGMVSRISTFILFGLSYNGTMIYSCAALCMFSEFPLPALRSMLSKTVSADERGKIFALTTVLQNLNFLLGSLVLMTIFEKFSFKGLSFEVVAALQGIPLVIFIYLYIIRRTYVTVYETIEHEDGSTSEICSVVESVD